MPTKTHAHAARAVIFAIVYFVRDQPGPGIISLIIAALVGFFYWIAWGRIPFAKVILKTVTSVTRRYPAMLLTSLLGGLLYCVFGVWWVLSVVGLLNRFRNSSSGGVSLMIIYLVLYLYWTVEIIANVVHVTVSGVMATVFFQGATSPSTGQLEVPVRNPTAKAAGRALTTSFGPIAFGSLLIAIIQTLKFLARSAQRKAGQQGNDCMAICCCCLACILGCMEHILRIFNTYAFVEVAIYGKGFWESGQAAYELFKARGFDAITNDAITGQVLWLGSLVLGLICALAGFFYGMSSNPNSQLVRWLFFFLGFIIGLVVFMILTTVISSGVTATFVCLAEDPAALARGQPELFARIQAVYPRVNWGAHSSVSV
jgi:hypothetical protein